MEYEKAKQEVIEEFVDDTIIKYLSKVKVNKDWRYDIGRRMLSPMNFKIFKKYNNMADPRHQLFTDRERENMERVVREYAFNKFDFGRKKNIDSGENFPHHIKKGPLSHEESFQYRGNFRGYTGSYLYSDYAFVIHRADPFALYRIESMKEPAEIMLSTKFPFEELSYQLLGKCKENGKTRASHITFRGLPIDWDEKERAFRYKGYIYHIYPDQLWIENDSLYEFVRRIIHSFHSRKKYDEIENLKGKASQVYVTVQDSINAGNCKKQTLSFAEKFRKEGQKVEDVTMRGDELLQIRNDQFTKRTINAAIERHAQHQTNGTTITAGK